MARQLKLGYNDGERAARVLRRAARRYPGDFRLHFELAHAAGAPVEMHPNSVEIFPDPEESVRHLTAALGIRPDSYSTHVVLSIALIAWNRLEEATAEGREAVRLRPDDASAHAILGNALRWRGRHDDAVAELREAVRLRPDDGWVRGMLALGLRFRGNFDDAEVEFHEAIRLRPDLARVYLSFAELLQDKGDFAGALAVVRKLRAQVSGPITDNYHPTEWFAKVESMAALDGRLPAILKGTDHPKDVGERLDLARIGYNKKVYAASAGFWAEALEADPKLGDDRRAQHRYNAACSAALAVAGQGKGEPTPDDAARADLRRRALRWLKAELAAWSRYIETDPPQDRAVVSLIMQHWQKDPDLAAVRDTASLASLPETERKDWLALWGEVDALMRKAGEARPR